MLEAVQGLEFYSVPLFELVSMACVDMFNTEYKGLYGPPMSPRISFSNDFIDTQQAMNHDHHRSREAPVASDFEFSVTNYTMMPADELFSKGTLVPFKSKTTLRDELLMDDDEVDISPRPPKSPTRWREFLGLKRVHNGTKKTDSKGDESMDKVCETNGSLLVHEEIQVSKVPQELLTDKESTFRDVEMEI